MNRALTLTAVAMLCFGDEGRAGIVSISSVGATLSSVIVERGGFNYAYTTGQLIGFDITSFDGLDGSDTPVILTGSGEGVPSTGNRAALLDGDNRLDTGIINAEQSASAVALTFDTPIVNSIGTDIMFFEVDPSGDDRLFLTINGTTLTVSDDTGSLQSGVSFDTYQAVSQNVDLLSELENDDFEYLNSRTQNVYGYSIDLSDFGVADGATITSLTYGSASSDVSNQAIDPVFIAGLPAVPEPASLELLALAGLMILVRRR